MLTTSASITEIAKALAKAQAKQVPAPFDKTNPHFRSKYASQASVWGAVQKPYTENGISIIQGATAEGASVRVTTMLLHTSGEWIQSTLTVQAQQASPQAIGSAITYARRYALAAMCSVVADDDDDGNAASEPPRQDYPRESAPQAAAALRAASGADRKQRALAYMTRRYGESMRVALARALDRTFPDGSEIKLTMAEIEKLEGFIRAEEAREPGMEG